MFLKLRSAAFRCVPFLAIQTNFARRSSRRSNPSSGKKNAAVFAFQPAKAGSGATTTALFVAHILATLAEKKVLVLECDLHAGPISMLYNLRPNYSIMDAVEDSHRLTDENWHEMVAHTGGIDVLSSVSRLGVRQVSPWGYQRLLSFVRSRYDVVIARFARGGRTMPPKWWHAPLRQCLSSQRRLRLRFSWQLAGATIWKRAAWAPPR